MKRIVSGSVLAASLCVGGAAACSTTAPAPPAPPYTGPVLVWQQLPQADDPDRYHPETWTACWGPTRLFRTRDTGFTSVDTREWPVETLGKCG